VTRVSRATWPRPARCEDGFTLVDTMVAMVLLGVTLIALAAAIPLASFATQQGWQQSAAAAIAEDVFEQMRITQYANLNSTTFPNQTSLAPNYQGFSYTIAFAANTPVANTTRITITVTYTGSQGSVSPQFTTIFACITC